MGRVKQGAEPCAVCDAPLVPPIHVIIVQGRRRWQSVAVLVCGRHTDAELLQSGLVSLEELKTRRVWGESA